MFPNRTHPAYRTNKRRWLLRLAAFSLLLLVARTAPAALPPIEGGKLTVLCATRFETLDPALAATRAERSAASQVTEPLFSLNGNSVEGRLAMRHVSEDGGRRLHVWLKPGILFHDGAVLSASDVRASFERLLDPATGALRFWRLLPIKGARTFREGKSKTLDGFEIVSPLEFILTLDPPIDDFAAWLADPATAIIPARAARERKPYPRPIGTGPFRVVSLSQAQAELLAFKDHHAGRPHTDRIGMIWVADGDTARRRLETGAADASMSGTVETPQGGRRDVSLIAPEIVILADEALHARAPGHLARLLSAMVPCKEVVKLFERRRIAPFAGEKIDGPVMVKAPDAQTGAFQNLMEQAAPRSCVGFKADAADTREAWEALSDGEPLELRVRQHQTALKLIAERIALVAEGYGIEIVVRALSANEMAAARQAGNGAELIEQPGLHLPGEERLSDLREPLVLYRLSNGLIWRDRSWLVADFTAFGDVALADLARREP